MSACKTFWMAMLAALTLIFCLPSLAFAQLKSEEQLSREVSKEIEKRLKATKLEYGFEQDRDQLFKALQMLDEAKSDEDKVRDHQEIIQTSTNIIRRIVVIYKKGVLLKSENTEDGYAALGEFMGKSVLDSIQKAKYYEKSPEKHARLETINLIVDIHNLAQALQNMLDTASEEDIRRMGLGDSEFTELGSSLRQACRDEIYQIMKADYDREVTEKALSTFNALTAEAGEVKFLNQTVTTKSTHRSRRVRLSFNFLEPLLKPFKLLFRLF